MKPVHGHGTSRTANTAASTPSDKPVRRARAAAIASSKPARETARRLSPEARRAQIIAKAEELFSTRTYAELGVPEVAKALGITPGLVYHYFPTKESLLVAAVELRARELLASTIPDKSLPFFEQMERGMKGYFDYIELHSLAYRNLLRGPTASDAGVLRICEEVRLAIVDHFMGAGGFAPNTMPATRLSLRAYVRFCENAILDWLELREIPRAKIERICLGMMIAAFRIGLRSDDASSVAARQLAYIENLYARNFGSE